MSVKRWISAEGVVPIPPRIVEIALPSVAAAMDIEDEAVWKDSMERDDMALGNVSGSSPPEVGWGERIVKIDDNEGGITADVDVGGDRMTVVL